MTGKRVSKAKIKAAIPGSGGIISQISKRTGYTWHAVKENIEADEELKHMLEDEEATIDDMAEATVITAIREGSTQDAKWWLARRRRAKFGDSVEVTDAPPLVQIVMPDNGRDSAWRDDRGPKTEDGQQGP